MKSNTSKNTRASAPSPETNRPCLDRFPLTTRNPSVPGFYAGRNAKEVI